MSSQSRDHRVCRGRDLHLDNGASHRSKVKTNPDLQQFLDKLELVEPLEPRHSFFGGRTNAATLYYKADPAVGEQIKYVDVTSL